MERPCQREGHSRGGAVDERSSPNPNKRPRTSTVPFDGVEEEQAEPSAELSLCTICMEPNTASGPHRLSVLPCGHLFGHGCILRWLNAKKTCPTCQKTTHKRSVRFIYTASVTVIDTEEKERYLRLVQEERKKVLQLEKANAALVRENHRLRATIKAYRKGAPASAKDTPPSTSSYTRKGPSIRIDDDDEDVGGVTSPQRRALTCVSLGVHRMCDGRSIVALESSNTFLTSVGGIRGTRSNKPYGLMHVFGETLGAVELLGGLHDKPIRGVCAGMVMGQPAVATTADDGKLRLTSVQSAGSICTIDVRGAHRSWACHFDARNPHHLLVAADSDVRVHDLRRPSGPLEVLRGGPMAASVHTIAQWDVGSMRRPRNDDGVASLPQQQPSTSSSSSSSSSLITMIGHFDGVRLWTGDPQRCIPPSSVCSSLGTGDCCSIDVDSNGYLLVSYRSTPSRRSPSHVVCKPIMAHHGASCQRPDECWYHETTRIKASGRQLMVSRSRLHTIPHAAIPSSSTRSPSMPSSRSSLRSSSSPGMMIGHEDVHRTAVVITADEESDASIIWDVRGGERLHTVRPNGGGAGAVGRLMDSAMLSKQSSSRVVGMLHKQALHIASINAVSLD